MIAMIERDRPQDVDLPSTSQKVRERERERGNEVFIVNFYFVNFLTLYRSRSP